MAGVSCLWRVSEYWRAAYGLPTELPPAMAERLRPARRGALQKVPSLQAAAAGEEGEAGGGEEAGGEEYDPADDAQLAEELAEEAAADSELSDDGE